MYRNSSELFTRVKMLIVEIAVLIIFIHEIVKMVRIELGI